MPFNLNPTKFPLNPRGNSQTNGMPPGIRVLVDGLAIVGKHWESTMEHVAHGNACNVCMHACTVCMCVSRCK